MKLKKTSLFLLYGSEYFSYYTVMVTLVLFLGQHLNLENAFSAKLQGWYSSLLYLMPIFGGIFADQFKASMRALFFGGMLLMIGFSLFAISNDMMHLYFAMTTVIIGFGLFRTNIYGVIRTYVGQDSLDGTLVELYYYGNIGALLGSSLAGYLASMKFEFVFLSAAVIFCVFWCVFVVVFREELLDEFKKYGNTLYLLSACAVAFVIFFIILCLHCVDVLSILLFFGGLGLFMHCYRKAPKSDHLRMRVFFLMMIFACVFWMCDFQIFNGLEFFVDSMVNRRVGHFVIPTEWVISMNTVAVIMGGIIVAKYFRLYQKSEASPLASLYKYVFGLIIIFMSYLLLNTLVYYGLEGSGQVALGYVAMAIFLIGLSEIFIDPVAIANIQKLKQYQNTLTGLYMVFSGSIASALAGELGRMLSSPSHEKPLMNYFLGLVKVDVVLGICVIFFILLCIYYTIQMRRQKFRVWIW